MDQWFAGFQVDGQPVAARSQPGDAAHTLVLCAGCGRTAVHSVRNGAPHWCGRCRGAAYCTAACQRADWKRHRLVCTTAAPSSGAARKLESKALPVEDHVD